MSTLQATSRGTKRNRDDDTNNASSPPVKKRKPARYHCKICDTNRKNKFFPKYNPSAECDHEINTCKSCLQKHVDIRIKNANTTTTSDEKKTLGIACPEEGCAAIVRSVNIELATTLTMHARFETLERTYEASRTAGWRWCLNPNCDAGQAHDSISKEDWENTKENICVCTKCGERACIPCNRPYHKGESCEAHQYRIKDRVKEEDESLELIKDLTRPCPHCSTDIEKDGGCDSMLCKWTHPKSINICY